MRTTTTRALLTKDEGVADLWWPYAPETGRYTIKTSGEETRGSLEQVLVRDRRGATTPLHIHHHADETFYVIDGRLTLAVGDERLDAGPGDFVLAPRGIPHAFVVRSERAEFLVTLAGADVQGDEGLGLSALFREVGIPVDGRDTPEPRLPGPEFAERMLAYGIELVGPPPFDV
jgi:quercetin dioxygenase-like cupin family protein